MTNFSKQFAEEIVLPDGSVASSAADVDKYLRQSNLALAGDYSAEYSKNVRWQQTKQYQQNLKAEIIQQYKRIIWK